jgi:hypothetical protein
MTVPATRDPSFGFAPGDHVCAFYNGSRNLLDDIVVDYVIKGLQAGDQVFGMVDDPAAIRSRIPDTLVGQDGMLSVLTEDEGYMPDGHFSKDGFIQAMEDRMARAAQHGYGRFRAVGDESFIIRHGVDLGEWFAAEAELNGIGHDYPHFFFCLYDVEQFDGETVMYVLKTHPRVYVNGILISNPHFQPAPAPA